LPAQNQRDLRTDPVSVPLNADEKTIKNPFIIPGLKKLDIDPRLNPENSFTKILLKANAIASHGLPE
jgi:chromosomal replication initiator protein